MAEVPNIGARVRYIGSMVRIENYQELPERIGREGVVVPLYDMNGNDVESLPGTWPVNVAWDNGDSVQSCFEGEVEKLD